MDISLRSLLTGVENLGLDAQSLRDFQVAVQSGQIDDKNYTHLMVTLDAQLIRAVSGMSEPMAVQLILSRLDKKLQSDLAGSHISVNKQVVIDAKELQSLIQSSRNVEPQSVEQPPEPLPDQTEVNQQILHQLRMVTEEMKDIKNGQFHTISPSNGSDVGGPESVFVNPIDEAKVQELETNITIKSKRSQRNLKDKVRRLRELKSGKEEEI